MVGGRTPARARAIAAAAGYASSATSAEREVRRVRLIDAVSGVDDVMVTAFAERVLGRQAVRPVTVGDGPARSVDLAGWGEVARRLGTPAEVG